MKHPVLNGFLFCCLLLLAGCGNRHTETIRKVETLMDQNQFVPALDELTIEIRKDPESVELKRLRVILLIRYERIDMAYQAYIELQKISKNDKVLLKALSNKDPKIRAGAARVLGLVGTPDAVQGLEKLLNDPEREVRRATVAALGDIRDQRVTTQLIAALKDDWWFVRSDAAQALGKIRDVAATGPLFVVMDDKDPSVQLAAENALLTLARQPGAPHDVYAQYAQSPNPEIKRVAVLGLSVMQDHSVVPVLLQMVVSPDPRKRAQSTRALGILRDPAGLAAVRKVATDSEPMVRLQALEALGEYRDAESTKMLEATAKNEKENPLVRRAAMVALLKIADAQKAAAGTPSTAP